MGLMEGMMLGNLNAIRRQQAEILQRQQADDQERARIHAQNQKMYDDVVDKYNELLKDYNQDTTYIAGQRDEALEIIKENIDVLPFTFEEAKSRIDAKGSEKEDAVKQKYGY